MRVINSWVLVAAAVAAAACGGEAETVAAPTAAASPSPTVSATAADSPAAAATAAGTTPAGQDATVAVASSDLGDILVSGDGMTLYLFDQDSAGTSACTGDCADLWPPLTAAGEPVAGDGVDAGLIGTIERDDGTTQVTYAGHPLYHYSPDAAPGDVTGQGVGEVWWVVTPAGEAIRDTAPAATGGAGGDDEDDPYSY